MRLAIAAATAGVEQGQSPFGACIARAGRVVSCVHNVVWADTDITGHAEVNAIRNACRALGTIDLSGCTIYSTCEPCPMCFAACHWARLDRIVFGVSIADAQALGFRELAISNVTMKALGGSSVESSGGCLREDNLRLFRGWRRRRGRRAY
ncbi:MAG: nucleoside deaminase [Deltaproteobacteria bacterium]|nr:nucleoside deaminase [Deltaproteobacteria bacterium]